jgi:hypothetical protein
VGIRPRLLLQGERQPEEAHRGGEETMASSEQRRQTMVSVGNDKRRSGRGRGVWGTVHPGERIRRGAETGLEEGE